MPKTDFKSATTDDVQIHVNTIFSNPLVSDAKSRQTAEKTTKISELQDVMFNMLKRDRIIRISLAFFNARTLCTSWTFG